MILKLKIITPNGIFFDDVIYSVTVKTTEGYVTILKNHVPLIANIVASSMFCTTITNTKRNMSIEGGLLITSLHEVRIITENIEYVSILKDKEITITNERIKKVSS